MGEELTTVQAARAEVARRSVRALADRLEGSHLPSHPAWKCQTCTGTPWPCQPARERLEQAYGNDRIGLSMYLGSLLPAALTEMPTTEPAELYERFVLWTR